MQPTSASRPGKGILRIGPFAFALLLVTASSSGQTTDYPRILSEPGALYNARAMGMGNAYSTIGYDYSAVRFNPATLAVADSFTFSMAVNYNAYPNSAEYQQTKTPFTTSNTSLNQFGITIPVSKVSRRAVIALGYTQSKDFNRNLKFSGYDNSSSTLVQDLTVGGSTLPGRLGLSYPGTDPSGPYQTILTGNLQQSGYVLESGSMLQFSLGASTETAANVFVGASFNYTYGTLMSDREFREIDTNNVYGAGVLTVPSDPATADFQSFYLHDVRDASFKGVDFKVGLLYKFYNFISIGASFKIPTPHSVSEDRTVQGSSVFASGTRTARDPMQTLSYTVTPAYEATVGAAVNLWFLTATAEATFIDYTQMSYKSGPDVLEIGLLNKNIAENYARVLNLNGGAELRIPFTGLIARAGFMYRPSPYKNDGAEFDRKYLTLGAGINSSGFLSFDLAYGYGWWQERYRGSGATFEGVTQNIQVHDILATIKVTFP
jgi:hypothetical protein